MPHSAAACTPRTYHACAVRMPRTRHAHALHTAGLLGLQATTRSDLGLLGLRAYSGARFPAGYHTWSLPGGPDGEPTVVRGERDASLRRDVPHSVPHCMLSPHAFTVCFHCMLSLHAFTACFRRMRTARAQHTFTPCCTAYLH